MYYSTFVLMLLLILPSFKNALSAEQLVYLVKLNKSLKPCKIEEHIMTYKLIFLFIFKGLMVYINVYNFLYAQYLISTYNHYNDYKMSGLVARSGYAPPPLILVLPDESDSTNIFFLLHYNTYNIKLYVTTTVPVTVHFVNAHRRISVLL